MNAYKDPKNPFIRSLRTSFHTSPTGSWMIVYYKGMKIWEISGKSGNERGRYCVRLSTLPESVKEYTENQVEVFNHKIGR